MNYFYLKIGAGNCLADRWLRGENDLNKPAAVIFFDSLDEGEYAKAAKSGVPPVGISRQPLDFYQSGLLANREQTRIVVIHQGRLLLMKPAEKVQFLAPNPEETGGDPHPARVLAR